MEFLLEWEAKVSRSVFIEAESAEEAHQKWLEGDYGKTDVDDEDIIGDYVELDGKAYWQNRFERVLFGNEKDEG